MSALLWESNPVVVAGSPATAARSALRSRLALIVGALTPWLLLVGMQGVLHQAAAACIAGPFPA